MVIPKELIDKIAHEEVQAILDGLKDPELRKNPAFLEKVRKFLQQNNFKTTPETPGVADIKKNTANIPIFDSEGVN